MFHCRSDAEIVGYTLETLCNVMSNELPEDGLFTSCILSLSIKYWGTVLDIYLCQGGCFYVTFVCLCLLAG